MFWVCNLKIHNWLTLETQALNVTGLFCSFTAFAITSNYYLYNLRLCDNNKLVLRVIQNVAIRVIGFQPTSKKRRFSIRMYFYVRYITTSDFIIDCFFHLTWHSLSLVPIILYEVWLSSSLFEAFSKFLSLQKDYKKNAIIFCFRHLYSLPAHRTLRPA